ncbi:hypothetical protein [Geobacillus stearothermophilus]|jgi:hypothetical protein|uniref:hypothetical protein n=1 Tax=Geobacillus stearothermophilus TaxID=1422 RepID=UPI002E1E80CF|nr:hypothetical protein [Geobacillus stearothermophilus]MED4960228.1 hypothetical protein [Geobacillus stearothermophilus]MED4986427.1 hypothetical protein [Geobacillus stearothermophilus]
MAQYVPFDKSNAVHQELLSAAMNSKEFNLLKNQVKKDGFTILEENVRVLIIDETIEGKEINAQLLRYDLNKGDQTVGEVSFVKSGNKTEQYAYYQVTGGYQYYQVKNGKVVGEFISSKEIKPLIANDDCRAIVQAICSAGFTGSIGECALGCATLGFAFAVCEPICVVLVSVGCYFGAKAICALV